MFRATQALAVSQQCAPNISRKYKGRSYRRILCLKFHFFFRAIFLNFRIFHYSAPTIGMRSVPNILPSVKFPNFGNVSCFSCFFCFSWEKKEEKLGKKSCSIRTALTTRYKDDACGQNINISGGGTLSVLRPLVFSPSLLPSKKHQHRFRMRYNDDACG